MPAGQLVKLWQVGERTRVLPQDLGPKRLGCQVGELVTHSAWCPIFLIPVFIFTDKHDSHPTFFVKQRLTAIGATAA